MNNKCVNLKQYLLASSLLFGSITTVAGPGLSPVAIASVDPATDGSAMVTITGNLDTIEPVSTMNINGYSTTMFDGETFSLQMPRANHYQINLYGDNSFYQAFNYAATDVAVDSALQVVVGDQLMQDLGPAMAVLLSDLNLNDVLGIGPDQCIVDTGWLIGCDFYITQLSIRGTPTVNLSFTPDNGEQLTVNIDMDIPQGVMSTKIKRALWWGYRNTTITTDNVRVSLQLGVKATDNQSVKLVLDDPGDVQMQLGTMRVQSNTLAAHLIPLFKDIITGVINNHVAQVAGPFLDHLPIPAIPLNLPVDIDGDQVNDAEFAINMNAELLDVLANGDGQVVLAGSIRSAWVAPGREAIGSRRIDGSVPNAEPVTAPTDVSANVAVDLVNQVLTAFYQSGLEEKISLPMKVKDLGEFGFALQFLGYDLEDDLTIRVSFGSSPELQVNNSSQYPLGLDMGIPNMRLQMAVVRGDDEEVIMDLNSDILVDTSLGAEGDGRLLLEFTDLLTLNDVIINGGTLSDALPPEVMAQIIALALPALISDFEPVINDLLNAVRLELDIGDVLNNWLNAEFPSLPVAGYITETGVNDDETYMTVGVGIDFP